MCRTSGSDGSSLLISGQHIKTDFPYIRPKATNNNNNIYKPVSVRAQGPRNLVRTCVKDNHKYALAMYRKKRTLIDRKNICVEGEATREKLGVCENLVFRVEFL